MFLDIASEYRASPRSWPTACELKLHRGKGNRPLALRLNSYSNNDTSISTYSCYWPDHAKKNTSETKCDQVRCNGREWTVVYLMFTELVAIISDEHGGPTIKY